MDVAISHNLNMQTLTLLHSGRPKLYTILAYLSAIGLTANNKSLWYGSVKSSLISVFTVCSETSTQKLEIIMVYLP